MSSQPKRFLYTAGGPWAEGRLADRVFPAGGNPYGASSSLEPTEADHDAARHLGERVASLAGRLPMAGAAAG